MRFINRAKELLSSTVVLYTPPIPNAPEQPITLADYLEYQTRAMLTTPITHPNHRHQTTLLDEMRISLGLGQSQELVRAVFRDLGATPEAQRLREEVDEQTYTNVVSCAVHLLCAQLEANAAHRVLESLKAEMVGYLEAALRREFSRAAVNEGDPLNHPLFSEEGINTFIKLVQEDVVSAFTNVMTSSSSLKLLLENIGVNAGRLQGLYQSWVQSTGYPLGYPTDTELLDDI